LALEAELLATLKGFFVHTQSLWKSIAVASPETLIREFSQWTTDARAALRRARGSLASAILIKRQRWQRWA
jgi:hypothetical protein